MVLLVAVLGASAFNIKAHPPWDMILHTYVTIRGSIHQPPKPEDGLSTQSMVTPARHTKHNHGGPVSSPSGSQTSSLSDN